MRYLLIALLLFCSSCIQIGSDPQPLQYYLLEAPAYAAKTYSSKELNIDIKLSNFPDYLDRPQVVTKGQKNTITLNEYQHWASPLEDNILQVIQQNLALSFPESNITVQPWEQAKKGATKLTLSIDKFFGDPGGSIDVIIRWKMSGADGVSQYGTFTDQHAVGEAFPDLITGLNDSLNRFSQSIAEKLANQ